MPTANTSDSINAGPFSKWLADTRAGKNADVPCGDCNACCRSSYFIHIGGDETAALEAVPEIVRFPAPSGQSGDQIMGFDQHGHCPMLKQDKCSVYASRPQTCREYDCRIFAACGINAGGDEKRGVNQRVALWAFEYPSEQDKLEQQALQNAMAFLQQHAGEVGLESVPSPTQLALLATAVFEWFLPERRESVAEKAAFIRNIVTSGN